MPRPPIRCLAARHNLDPSGALTDIGNKSKAARVGVPGSGRSLASWGEVTVDIRISVQGYLIKILVNVRRPGHKLSITTHADSSIRDGNVR
jgi:hypothetical protein